MIDFPDVEIIIPWAPTGPERRAALEWVTRRLPAPVTIAPGDGDDWSKGLTAWPAIRSSDAEILVIHDADVHCESLPQAVRAVASGAPWAIPHDRVHRLTAAGTRALLAGEPGWLDLEEPAYQGIPGGGIIVARRDVLLDVPLDPRFRGWGGEDESWAMALHTLHGPAPRGDADLTHLWHPPQRRLNRVIGNDENWELYLRYKRARHDPVAMLELTGEAHAALEASAIAP